MRQTTSSLLLINKLSLCICIVAMMISGCDRKNNKLNDNIKHQLQLVDSLGLAGKKDSLSKLIPQIRAGLNVNNVHITDYYRLKAESNLHDTASLNLYADSALAFFNSDNRKNEFADEYFKTLLVKAEACLRSKKYITALNYYYIGKKILTEGNCDNGCLDGKMGSIYFNQKNYPLAAKYLAESYHRLESCDDGLKPEQLFFNKQGCLNNTGLAYQKAGMPDSAMHYYLLDLNLVNQADSDGIFSKNSINGAKVVIYDNIGGLYLLQDSLRAAEEYLKQCLSTPTLAGDGILIPPNLKLAQLYTQNGELNKATEAFKRSKALLDLYKRDNPESELKWNKLYAEYLYKLQQPKEAYLYQTRYIKLRDSLDNRSAELYRLDVERELSTIQQQNDLAELVQKNGIKQTYIIGIAVIALLSVVIIILINRNLKRIKKNHRNATLQNIQMQHTMDELERVNQNYIRIMRVMAHDLRNPLSGITGLAAMMLDDQDFTEENKHMLKLIETTGTHSMEMINELLKSGLANDNEVLVTQTLDLRSLLFDSVELLQFKADEKNQRLLFESNEQSIMANVNHEKIWRVFNNIIVNAIKFSHPNSDIKISIRTNGKTIMISVTDKGIGIPDKDKNNIFEMFTPAKKMGTQGEQPFGLGLSISKKLIEKHKGHIWFKSEPGEGTTFYIELPALT